MAKQKIVKNPRTDADVALLIAVFPDLLPDGRHIAHTQIESVLKLGRLTGRYHTVVAKWRRVVFDERRVFLNGRLGDGTGFVALTPDEMVRYANRQVRSAGRKLRHALAVASAPNDEQLSEDVRRYRRLLEAAAMRIAQEHKRELHEVAKAMAPMKQLPRVAVGE